MKDWAIKVEVQMILDRWKPIIPHLQEFQFHLAAHVTPLQIEPASIRSWTQQEYLAQCKTGIFNKCGVYLLFAEDNSLQYVGVAMNTFHNRIWSHDADVSRYSTDVICFPQEFYFFALALEFFLISRLRPPGNDRYSDHVIPRHSTYRG